MGKWETGSKGENRNMSLLIVQETLFFYGDVYLDF